MNVIERVIALSGRADCTDKALVAEVSRRLKNPSFLAAYIFDFIAPSARRERVEIVALLAYDKPISNRAIPARQLQDAVKWFEYAIWNTLEYVLVSRAREKAACRKKAT